MNTNVHDDKVPNEGFQYVYLSVILINSVFRTGQNYYLQVILEECKYVVKEKRMPKYITEGIEISFDESVKEILTKKILAKKNLMKKIKLVPSASFRYKRKAEKRLWNTLNT